MKQLSESSKFWTYSSFRIHFIYSNWCVNFLCSSELVIYCCITNFPRSPQHNNSLCVWDNVINKQLSWALMPGVSGRLQSRRWAGLRCPEGSRGDGSSTSKTAVQVAGPRREASGPCHTDLYWVSLWHGDWLPPERAIQVRVRWKPQWVLWSRIGSHTRSHNILLFE